MLDATQLLAQLSPIRDCAFHIVDKHKNDYPDKEEKTLRRLARSCASVEFNTTPHTSYFGFGGGDGNKLRKATWNDEGQVVSGFVKELPELEEGRLFLALDNGDGRKFLITWEDE